MKKVIRCSAKEGTLHIENMYEEVIVQIFDNKGILYWQFVAKTSSEKVDLPAPGIYLVVIQMVNETLVHKVKWE